MATPKAKRKGKPQRLVKPEKTTLQAQKIIALNATQSPFLELSPEIRNRIYALVLGGNDIHVYNTYINNTASYSLCVAAEPKANVVAATYTDDSTYSEVGWSKLHNACVTYSSHESRSPVRLDLLLLKVSKQIHQEAALLPFTLNSFGFPALHHVGCFVNKLLMAQKLAISRIEVRATVWEHEMTKKDRSSIMKLRGLQSLTYVLEDRSDINDPPSLDMVRGSLEFAKEIFRVHQPATAKVHVRAFAGICSVPYEIHLPEEYRDLARETERAFLKEDVQDGVDDEEPFFREADAEMQD